MAKLKNKSVYSEDREYLKRLADELAFLGRHYVLDLKEGKITQLVYPPRKAKKKEREHEQRNKKAESAGRRNKSD